MLYNCPGACPQKWLSERASLMDDNERSSSREMSLRVLPCSKWRRRTRACSLAVMCGVLEASMSTRFATMWAKLQAVGIKRLWTTHECGKPELHVTIRQVMENSSQAPGGHMSIYMDDATGCSDRLRHSPSQNPPPSNFNVGEITGFGLANFCPFKPPPSMPELWCVIPTLKLGGRGGVG